MMAILIMGAFMVAADAITHMTWKARNQSPDNLLLRGMSVLLFGGFMGLAWSTALAHPGTGPLGELFLLMGFLGHLLSMYAAVLASALVRTAWSEGHTPVLKKY